MLEKCKTLSMTPVWTLKAVRDGYMSVMCDWLFPDSLGEQFSEVGPERAEAEVPREAHQKPV